MPRELELRELVDADPVNPFGNRDLSMFAVPTSRRKIPARPCQRTPSPARQLRLIREVTGDARLVLRWLALRGAPPGNRCLPDMSYILTPAEGIRQVLVPRANGSERTPYDEREGL